MPAVRRTPYSPVDLPSCNTFRSSRISPGVLFRVTLPICNTFIQELFTLQISPASIFVLHVHFLLDIHPGAARQKRIALPAQERIRQNLKKGLAFYLAVC